MIRKQIFYLLLPIWIGSYGIAHTKTLPAPTKNDPVKHEKHHETEVKEVKEAKEEESHEKEESSPSEEAEHEPQMKITSISTQITAMARNPISDLPTKSKTKHWRTMKAGLGHFEAEAEAKLAKNLNATLTLETDDPEAIEINQALGEWELEPVTIIFGQQDFNFGLFPSHEVGSRNLTEPLMLEGTEINATGVTVNYELHPFNLGIGATSLETIHPSTARASSHAAIILNADYAPEENQIARLSYLYSSRRQAFDGAVNVKYGDFQIDWETMIRVHDEMGFGDEEFLTPATDPLISPVKWSRSPMRKGGMSLELAWQVTPIFQPAIRYDVIGSRARYFGKQLFTAGLTVTPIPPLFFGAEGSVDAKGVPFYALQMGLQAALDFE